MYHVITKEKIFTNLIPRSTEFQNIHPLLKNNLSELVIRGDRHTIAAKQQKKETIALGQNVETIYFEFKLRSVSWPVSTG